MKKKSILLFILLISLNYLYSQTSQKTIYQKKCESITYKFFKDLGVDISQFKDLENASTLEGVFLLGSVTTKLNTEKGIMLMFKYEREMRAAESLKTQVDFKREQKEKEEEIQKQAKKELQEEILRKKEEILRKKQENEIKYLNSDYVKITNAVKKSMEVWISKDEFEKTEDYNKRIERDSKNKFEKIIINEIENSISNNTSDINTELLQYNADLEVYPLQIKYNENEWIDTLSIPIKDAAKFKNDFNYSYYKTFISNYEWVLQNNYWAPKSFSLINDYNIDEQIDIYLEVSDFSDFYLDTKDINLNNSIGEFYFSWLEYSKKRITEDSVLMARQLIINDSLEILQKEEQARLIKIEKEKERLEKIEEEEKEKKALETKILTEEYNRLDKLTTVKGNDIVNKYQPAQSKRETILLNKFVFLNNTVVEYLKYCTLKQKIEACEELNKIDDFFLNLNDKKEIKKYSELLENLNTKAEIIKIILPSQ